MRDGRVNDSIKNGWVIKQSSLRVLGVLIHDHHSKNAIEGLRCGPSKMRRHGDARGKLHVKGARGNLQLQMPKDALALFWSMVTSHNEGARQSSALKSLHMI